MLDADTLPPPAMLTRPAAAGADRPGRHRHRLSLDPARARQAAGRRRLLSLDRDGRRHPAALAVAGTSAGAAPPPSAARALERLDLPRLWDRAMSDDMVLSRAAHRAAGLLIYAPLTVRPPSAGRRLDTGGALRIRPAAIPAAAAASARASGRSSGWAWCCRRWAARRRWAAVAAGDPVALACIGLAMAAARPPRHPARRHRRARPAARRRRRGDRALRRGRWWQPLAHLLHLLAWIGSATGRRLDWAGRRYDLGPYGRGARGGPARSGPAGHRHRRKAVRPKARRNSSPQASGEASCDRLPGGPPALPALGQRHVERRVQRLRHALGVVRVDQQARSRAAPPRRRSATAPARPGRPGPAPRRIPWRPGSCRRGAASPCRPAPAA